MPPQDDHSPEPPPRPEPDPGDPAVTGPAPASDPPGPTGARWGGLLAIGVVVLAVLILLLGFLAG